jgi:hypothetical protein
MSADQDILTICLRFFGRNIDPDQLLGAINGWVLYGSKADIRPAVKSIFIQ